MSKTLKRLTKPTQNTSNYGNNAFTAFAKASKNFSQKSFQSQSEADIPLPIQSVD